jgi:hypothetical protein
MSRRHKNAMDQLLKRLGRIGGFAVTSLAAAGMAMAEALEKADKAGYERGYAAGAQEAREELATVKKQLYAIASGLIPEAEIKPSILGAAASITPKPTIDISSGRAPRGSVAPAVIDALRSSNRGMSPREVADKAKIPENSARGSLNKLIREGTVEKRGSLWFLAKNEEAAKSSRDDHAASESVFD